MRKLFLFIVMMAIAIVTTAQIRTNVVTMQTMTENFAIAQPAYSIISVKSNDNVYLITSYYDVTKDMNDVVADGNYVDLTAGGLSFWESPLAGVIAPISGVTTVQMGSDANNQDGLLQFVASDGDLINMSINTDDQLGITGGNVGIGTASPTELLHVEGNGYIKDTLKIEDGAIYGDRS
jgi:FlaG/FlaF family flagellin (archaellin)